MSEWGVQGTALWRLEFGGYLNVADLGCDAADGCDSGEQIKDIPPGPDLIFEGDGDVWHFIDTPTHGSRTFEYDPRRAIFSRMRILTNIRCRTTSISLARGEEETGDYVRRWSGYAVDAEDPGHSEREAGAGDVFHCGCGGEPSAGVAET